jgi:hypothetical protein
MTKRIGIAAVFLVGCAVGGGAGQLVVPKASAQQATTLTKWEYDCNQDNVERTIAFADEAGAQGWEMVGVTTGSGATYTACFKRPKM